MNRYWLKTAGLLCLVVPSIVSCGVTRSSTLESRGREKLPPAGEFAGGAPSVVLLQDPLQPAAAPSDARCRAVVWLRGVYHGGDDIGGDWRYVVSVNEDVWISEEREVERMAYDLLEERVYDRVLEGGCSQGHEISITVRAREDDPLLDDLESGFGFGYLPCSGETAHIAVLVPVRECPSFLEPLPTATLVFLFQVQTTCEE